MVDKSFLLKEKAFWALNIFMLALTVMLSLTVLLLSIFVIRTGAFLRPLPVVICTLLLGAVFILFYRLFSRYICLFLRYERALMPLSFLIYAAALFWFGNRLIIVPEYDLDLVQETAWALALGERGADVWHIYFSQFTNQIPITLLLAAFYRLGLLIGVTDYYIIGNFFNAVAIALTMLLCYRFARRFFPPEIAFCIYLFLILNPIWPLYVSWSSTDTFCLPFLMSGLLLLTDALEGRYRWLRIAAGFFLIAISFTIRAVNIIPVIAFFIYTASVHSWKKVLKALLIAVAAFWLCSVCYHAVCEPFDAPYHTDQRMPVTHWLMIGSNERTWGEFAQEDYELDISLPGYEERSETSRRIFFERIREMFPLRLIKHCIRKMAENWSSGYCIETTWQSVRAPGTVFEYTVGEKSAVVQYLCQAFRVLLYACLLIISLYRLIKRKSRIRFLLTAWLGALAFYLLWEAGQRYSLSFVPWLSIAAGEALTYIKPLWPSKGD